MKELEKAEEAAARILDRVIPPKKSERTIHDIHRDLRRAMADLKAQSRLFLKSSPDAHQLETIEAQEAHCLQLLDKELLPWLDGYIKRRPLKGGKKP